jgi:hypothetical protein
MMKKGTLFERMPDRSTPMKDAMGNPKNNHVSPDHVSRIKNTGWVINVTDKSGYFKRLEMKDIAEQVSRDCTQKWKL